MNEGFLSRQPIHEASIHLQAYQIQSQLAGSTGSLALSLGSAEGGPYSEAGLRQLVGAHPAYIAVTADAIRSGQWEFLPKERVLLEVLEDIVLDDGLRDRLRALIDKGYRIAMDENPERSNADLELADVVRVNVANLDEQEIADRILRLSELSVKLLADKVDSYELFELSRKAGFDYFQGFFFCTPRPGGENIPVNRLATVRLLGRLRDPEITPDELEETIRTDLALTYKLLRYANSAYIGLQREVESVGHAARLVGLERLRLWGSLLMFSKMEDKPRELMVTAIVRGAMCERLAMSARKMDKGRFFTVGLLSVLDALLDCPMEQALAKLPLAEEIREALLRWEGAEGEALRCVLLYEQGRWDQVAFMDLAPATIRAQYLDSLGWTQRMLEGLRI